MNRVQQKKIKVLFLASWYPNEDRQIEGIFIKRHAEAVSRFCEVCVLYIHHGTKRQKPVIGYSHENGIKTIRVYPGAMRLKNIFFSNLNLCISMYRGMKAVKKEFGQPDIVHVNVSLPMGILAVALDIFKGIPYVVTEHFTGFSEQTKKIFCYFGLNIIFKRAKYILPVSETLKQSMELFYQTDKYQIIPNVINIQFFSPKNAKKNPLKKQILHVSLLEEKRKNISGIIFAMYDLSKIRSDFELHIIGDGSDRKYLENLCTRFGIKDTIVFFHGLVSDLELAEYMRNSDFFVLNSTKENFSVVCAEALASGIPVLSTRCGGPEEYIDENVGILIVQDNKHELVTAINYLLDNSDTYNPTMLHNYIKNKFGYDSIGKQIHDIYTAILRT
jgi:glycosyltransferase involved in cell wall biosynthesis